MENGGPRKVRIRTHWRPMRPNPLIPMRKPSTEMIKAVERAAETALGGPHDSCTVEELRQMLPVEMSASNELSIQT